MRRARRLFLVLTSLLVAGVAVSYYIQRAFQSGAAPARPATLSPGVQASSQDWVYYKGDGDRPVVEVRARDMQRVEEPSPRLLLQQVELRLFHKDGKEFDLVKSASAEFNEEDSTLFSDGDVEITLAVPVDETQTGRLLTIRSSGVKIDSASGRATTDRLSRFEFDLGEGEAVGATYDPAARELVLHSAVKLAWRGRDRARPPMFIESRTLTYKEADSLVLLGEWCRFRRQNLSLEAGPSVVALEDGAIRRVDAEAARGVDQYPDRQLEFGADRLEMLLTARSEIEKITGTGQARLQARGGSGVTDIRSARVDLDFDIGSEGSTLKTALATGQARLESHPLVRPGHKTPATRLLASDSVVMTMHPGGQEIKALETHAPATLDLIPNEPDQPRRRLNAGRLWVDYAERNQLRAFRAVEANTQTEKPARPRAPNPPPMLTSSRAMTGEFDPATGELLQLTQWDQFSYQEGDSSARAEEANLNLKTELITLSRSARAWDPTGSVDADLIVMHQRTGDFIAEGNVKSTRLPEKRQAAGGAMLSGDEPLQGQARRLESAGRNQVLTYQGAAVLWQGANRLQAERVVIRRNDGRLLAEGNVVSQFYDRGANPPTGRRVLTTVRAPALDYNDRERLAHYTGGIRLIRDGLDVKARELRAWLKDASAASSGSSLERAFADGSAEVFQASPGRTRLGTAEHAEYYVVEEKVVLNGGGARLVDSVKGVTRGRQLTYWAHNDTLQVEGASTQPVVSRIRRR